MAKSTRIIRILTMPSCENCTAVRPVRGQRHPKTSPFRADSKDDCSVALRRIPAAAVISRARPEDCNKLQALKAGTKAGY